MMRLKCGEYFVDITNEQKIYFPPDISKGDIASYYHTIAPYMVPHMRNHPFTMLRFPEGIKGEQFYQKDIPDYFPQYVERIKVEKKGNGHTTYGICNNQATLVYLAQQGCITPHLWLSTASSLHKPDKIVIDLDPSAKKVNFEMVREAAFDCKKIFESFDLQPHPMLTGSRGAHIVIHIKQQYDFDKVHKLALQIAQHMERVKPQLYTTEMRKNKRGGKIFLDTLRIGFGATAVAPYAVRGLPGAPVATPITWEELAHKSTVSQSYNIWNIFKLLQKRPDPLLAARKVRYSITHLIKYME